MNYDELKNSMPNATYFYVGVTMSDIENLPGPASWFGQFRGAYYCGTTVSVPGLAELEVLPE